MIDAYFDMSHSLMVPKAEKTDRMSSSVRSLWMLARYNLDANVLEKGNFQVLHNFTHLLYSFASFMISSMHACAWGIWLGLPTWKVWIHISMVDLPEAEISRRYRFSLVRLSLSSTFLKKCGFQVATLMFLAQTRIPFIWSRASWAASGCSNSTNAKPWQKST